jgi:hypothetical protein
MQLTTFFFFKTKGIRSKEESSRQKLVLSLQKEYKLLFIFLICIMKKNMTTYWQAN